MEGFAGAFRVGFLAHPLRSRGWTEGPDATRPIVSECAVNRPQSSIGKRVRHTVCAILIANRPRQVPHARKPSGDWIHVDAPISNRPLALPTHRRFEDGSA